MAGSGFGEHLKREREMRGVSIDEIAAATRISTRFLAALEQEAWDRLPGGVFNRGFVRTVARFLGLEEESLLAEYSLATGKQDAPPPAPVVLSTLSSAENSKFPWMRLAAIAIVLVLAAGAWFGWRSWSIRRAALDAAAASVPAAPVPPATPPTLLGASDVSTDSSSVSASAPGPQASAGPSTDPGQALQLKINADKDTALKITADGQPAFAGAISAGQSRTITAKSTFTVEAQDAGAIRMELNGEAVAPMGPSGQPGNITLGRQTAPPDAGGHD